MPPGPAVHKERRQRRPTGAPPPLPHPFAVSTAAWLVLGAVVIAGAFLASQHTPWLRLDDRFSTWVLRWLAGMRTPWLTDVANGINGAGSGWGATVLGLSVVALTMAFRRWRHLLVFFGSVLFLEFDRDGDLLRAVAAAPVRRADHRQLGRVLRGVPPGGGRHDLLDGRRLLPGRAGPRPLLDQGGGGRGGRRVRPGPPVPGRRSPWMTCCSAWRSPWRSRSPRSVSSPRTRCSRSRTGAATPRTWM